MKTSKSYLNQYYEPTCEWHRNQIDIDNASENEAIEILNLKEKAIVQSGLTYNEVALVCRCRKNGIFKKVNTYSLLASRGLN